MEKTWYWYCPGCSADGEVKALINRGPDGNERERRKFLKKAGAAHRRQSAQCEVQEDGLTIGPTPFLLTRIVSAAKKAAKGLGRFKIAVRDEGDVEFGLVMVKHFGGEKALKRVKFVVVPEGEREQHPVGSFM